MVGAMVVGRIVCGHVAAVGRHSRCGWRWSSVQAMGFERDDVVAALRATQNNRGMAVNRLLQMSSS